MKIVHCSTSVCAASANTRLHLALRAEGIDSKILVLEKSKEEIESVYEIEKTFILNIKQKIIKKLEYYFLRIFYNKQMNMPFSFGIFGIDISDNEILSSADVIHLHWINGGFLSIRSIEKLLAIGKPIVWSAHDSWPLTGGCHVKYNCERYKIQCGKCPILNSTRERDITSFIWRRKEKLMNSDIVMIAPSRWTYSNIKNSGLFSQHQSYILPNTLDTEIFKPLSKETMEEQLKYDKDVKKLHLLFGAVSSTTTPYKGYQYLVKALEIVSCKYPQIKSKLVIHIFGEEESKKTELSGYEHKFWGYISKESDMACLYNLADIYVVPSLEDSFNQTVAESLSCETPVVSFSTGGIVDIVDHKQNGYLAEYKNAEDLVRGILWVYENNRENILGITGRKKMTDNFSLHVVAEQYIKLYKTMILNAK